MAVTVKLSKTKAYLVVEEVEFVDGFQSGDLKRGILMIDPEEEPEAVLAKAKKAKLTLGSEEDDNGFYKVFRGKAKAKKDDDE